VGNGNKYNRRGLRKAFGRGILGTVISKLYNTRINSDVRSSCTPVELAHRFCMLV